MRSIRPTLLRGKTNRSHFSDESSAARNCPVPSSPRTPAAPICKTRRKLPSPPPRYLSDQWRSRRKTGQDTCQN